MLETWGKYKADGIINGHCHTFCFYSCSRDKFVTGYTIADLYPAQSGTIIYKTHLKIKALLPVSG